MSTFAEEHQRQLRNESTGPSGLISSRFVKKACFVYLQHVAPSLAAALLTADSHSSSTASPLHTILPVLEVVMELPQHIPVAVRPTDSGLNAREQRLDAETTALASTSGSLKQHRSSIGNAANATPQPSWNAPPRYQRMNAQRRAEQQRRVGDPTAAGDTSRFGWAGAMRHGGADAGTMLVGTVPRQTPSASTSSQRTESRFPIEYLPNPLSPPQVDSTATVLTSLSLVPEDFLRYPPQVAAYRLVRLSDCPPEVQRRAQLDPAVLPRNLEEVEDSALDLRGPSTAAHRTKGPLFLSDLAATSFLCWCRLYAENGRLLLFSDAMVMQRHDAVAILTERCLARMSTTGVDKNLDTPPPPAAATSDAAPAPLPLHYLQNQIAAAQHRRMLLQNSGDSDRIVELIAQRALRLEIELMDKRRSQEELPDAFVEDRYGLPRQLGPGSLGSRNGLDVTEAVRHWVTKAQHQAAPSQESTVPSSFQRRRSSSPPTMDAAAGISVPSNHEMHGALADPEELFCVPHSRVRIGDLGLHVSLERLGLPSSQPSAPRETPPKTQTATAGPPRPIAVGRGEGRRTQAKNSVEQDGATVRNVVGDLLLESDAFHAAGVSSVIRPVTMLPARTLLGGGQSQRADEKQRAESREPLRSSTSVTRRSVPGGTAAPVLGLEHEGVLGLSAARRQKFIAPYSAGDGPSSEVSVRPYFRSLAVFEGPVLDPAATVDDPSTQFPSASWPRPPVDDSHPFVLPVAESEDHHTDDARVAHSRGNDTARDPDSRATIRAQLLSALRGLLPTQSDVARLTTEVEAQSNTIEDLVSSSLEHRSSVQSVADECAVLQERVSQLTQRATQWQ